MLSGGEKMKVRNEDAKRVENVRVAFTLTPALILER